MSDMALMVPNAPSGPMPVPLAGRRLARRRAASQPYDLRPGRTGSRDAESGRKAVPILPVQCK